MLTLKTALVTGGTQGIGFEVAKALALSRARVLLVSRKAENGEAAVQKIKQETSGGADIEFIECDLGSCKNVREVADRIRENEKRLDIVRPRRHPHLFTTLTSLSSSLPTLVSVSTNTRFPPMESNTTSP